MADATVERKSRGAENGGGSTSGENARRIRVAVNGCGAGGMRVAQAVASQEDMTLVGIAVSDTGARAAPRAVLCEYPLYASERRHTGALRAAGLGVKGTLGDLLGVVDVVIDCAPASVAARNTRRYRAAGVEFLRFRSRAARRGSRSFS